MATVRKTRRDTVQGAVNSFQDVMAADVLAWPESMPLPEDQQEAAQAKLEFSNLQKGRARSHWRPHHAAILADAALMGGQLAKLSAMLIKSGPIIKTEKGHATRSPILDSMSMVASLRGQALKQLGLVGERAERDGVATGQNQARQTMKQVYRDDADQLLAGCNDDLLA